MLPINAKRTYLCRTFFKLLLLAMLPLILLCEPLRAANSSPHGANKTISISGTNTYTFQTSDFGFVDTDTPPNGFNGVKITTTPTNGSLTWNGSTLHAGALPYLNTPAGTNLTRSPLSIPWVSVASSTNGAKLVAGASGQLYTSVDSGVTWHEQDVAGTWLVASSADGSKLFAADRDTIGSVYTSTNSGTNWTSRTISGTSFNWAGVASSSDGSKLAVADFTGNVYTSTNSGTNWTIRFASITGFAGLAMSADGTKMITVSNLSILVSTNTGNTWQVRFTNGFNPATIGMSTIAISSDATKSFVFMPDFLYISTNLFASWTSPNAPANVGAFASAASSSDGSKIVLLDGLGNGTNGGKIYTSSDGGLTWNARENNRAWVQVTSSSDGTKLVAVEDPEVNFLGDHGGRVYTSTDSGVTWTPQFSDAGRNWFYSASSADGTRLVVVDDGGNTFTSPDGGVSWVQQNVIGGFIASSSDGSRLVTASDQIYISSDYGTNWTARGLGGKVWGGVASSADGRKLVAVDNEANPSTGGLIYVSVDSGTNWTARGSSHYWTCVASSWDGTRLAAADGMFGSGRIYTSIDSGTNWTAQSQSPSGCMCVVSSSDGTKLVATDQVFTYISSNGGTNWITNGVSLYAIVSSADGTRLAAISYGITNAFLYISTDSGLFWTQAGPAGQWNTLAISSDAGKLFVGEATGHLFTSVGTNVPLVYTASPGLSGQPLDSFTFQVEDDGGTGNGGVNLDPTPRTMTLNVAQVPYISQQPSNQLAYLSGNASFTVTAIGATSYRWRFNGQNTTNTGSTLTLTNLQTAQAGSYTVVVSNATGSGTSAPALLTVVPAQIQFIRSTVSTDGRLQLNIQGLPGAAFVIDTSTNLFSAWQPLVTLTNTTGTIQYLDLPVSNYYQRYFRLRPSP